MKNIFLILFFIPFFSFAQSDIDKVLKGGEIIVNGLSFFKSNKPNSSTTNSKVVESVCVKNNLPTK